MGRIILGVIVGFVVWTILWLGIDGIFQAFSPGWYGKNFTDFQDAFLNGKPYTYDSTILLIGLVRSFITSIIAGFVAVLISKEHSKTTLSLGILLLLTGIFFQVPVWNYIPIWYNLIFLILLIPFTILGGKLRKQEPIA